MYYSLFFQEEVASSQAMLVQDEEHDNEQNEEQDGEQDKENTKDVPDTKIGRRQRRPEKNKE